MMGTRGDTDGRGRTAIGGRRQLTTESRRLKTGTPLSVKPPAYSAIIILTPEGCGDFRGADLGWKRPRCRLPGIAAFILGFRLRAAECITIELDDVGIKRVGTGAGGRVDVEVVAVERVVTEVKLHVGIMAEHMHRRQRLGQFFCATFELRLQFPQTCDSTAYLLVMDSERYLCHHQRTCAVTRRFVR